MLRSCLCGLVLSALALSACAAKDEKISPTPGGDAGTKAPPNGDDDSTDMTAPTMTGTGPTSTGTASGSSTGGSNTGGNGGSGSLPTSSTGTTTPPLTGNVPGGNCNTDDDCMEGLFCLLEDNNFFSGRETAGVIAGGFCTARCETNQDVCGTFGGAASCLTDNGGTKDDTSDDVGYCLEYCQVADGSFKCGGSLDQMCLILNDSGGGACFPFCLDDAGCAAGAFCDPADGLCRDEPAKGKPVGDVCEADDECTTDYCWKLNDSDVEGVCSGQCAFFGGIGGCGVAPPDAEGNLEEPPGALCFPLVQNSAENDPGICLGTCDDNADCGLPTFECSLFSEEAQAVIGRAGICLPTEEALNGALDGGVPMTPAADGGEPAPATGDGGDAPTSTGTGSGDPANADSGAAPSAGDAG